eukprot:1710775-Amphidinium_carterae.1
MCLLVLTQFIQWLQLEDFIAEELHPLLLEQAENEKSSFNLYWYGDEIDEFEIWKALKEDAHFMLTPRSAICGKTLA